MIYKIKMKLRNLYNKNRLFRKIYVFFSNLKTFFYKFYSDEKFYKKVYKQNTGKELNLDNPIELNEKILWLQINDQRDIYTELTDKLLAKNYVKNLIGEEFIIPTIKVWEDAKDIDFDNLPEEYVLKTNHDSGSVYIKKANKDFNTKKVKKKLDKSMKRNYYDVGRIWGYKNIKPKIFAEEIIQTNNNESPIDYKFFCFNGEPKFIFVGSNRDHGLKIDFFDIHWNKLPIKDVYPNSDIKIKKPNKFEEMIEISKKLSRGFPHVRIDLYIDKNDVIKFGEFTFASGSATDNLSPDKYNKIFGEYIDLEKVEIHRR